MASWTPARFMDAVDRATQEGLHVAPIVNRPGRYMVSSGSVAGRWYQCTLERCSCPAGGAGCKHIALVAYVTGRANELVPDLRYHERSAVAWGAAEVITTR